MEMIQFSHITHFLAAKLLMKANCLLRPNLYTVTPSLISVQPLFESKMSTSMIISLACVETGEGRFDAQK